MAGTVHVVQGEEGPFQSRRGGAGRRTWDGRGGTGGDDGGRGASGVDGAGGGDVRGQAVQLEAALLQLLQFLQVAGKVVAEQRPLVVARWESLLRPNDAGGPVQVKHVDKLLLLLLQLLNLGFQLSIDTLQLFRFLEGKTKEETEGQLTGHLMNFFLLQRPN